MMKHEARRKDPGRVCVVYESGTHGGAWKGERVGELLEKLDGAGFRVVYVGLRGLLGAPLLASKRRVCLFFALPGQASRLVAFFSAQQRDIRTAISMVVFAGATCFLSPRTVLTQTTLGRLVEKLRKKGHFVCAECDMTCPRAWQNILLREARRIGATEEIMGDMPSLRRQAEEERAFRSADRIVVFSPWAARNLPEDVRAKAVVVPSHSTAPAARSLGDEGASLPIEFLYVGQIGFRKGFHILIEALQGSSASEPTCHVFGTVRDGFGRFMSRTGMQFPAVMRLHGQGDWRAFVRQNPRRYVAVLPSLVEGSPRVVYEAAALGVPAIVAPAARPAFFDDVRNALVLSRPDAGELRSAMSRILEEKGLWEQLSEATYRTYATAYRTASYGNRMVELITDVSAGDRA